MSLEKFLYSIETPAFVYDEGAILKVICDIQNLIDKDHCRLLFTLKSFSSIDALYLMEPFVDGFSCSSLFESRLAREILGNKGTVHMTTPGFKSEEIPILSELCDYISLNSLSQWERYRKEISPSLKYGLRINPQLSFVKDERYDPCRKHSKLGVPLSNLVTIVNSKSYNFECLSGLHFHTNCESIHFDNLLKTVKHIDKFLPGLLEHIEWINVGGGYLFEEAHDLDLFREAIFFLNKKYGLEIFFEPGKGIVGEAGYIISTVIDVFESDGQNIAVLDTTTNHMPEVFLYQYKPDVRQESKNGQYSYELAGSSCLAGDLFGQYSFDEPLEIGSIIVFEGMGAYTTVKANMFNGINLPTVYALKQNGKIELKKQFDYEDFKTRCGEKNDAST